MGCRSLLKRAWYSGTAVACDACSGRLGLFRNARVYRWREQAWTAGVSSQCSVRWPAAHSGLRRARAGLRRRPCHRGSCCPSPGPDSGMPLRCPVRGCCASAPATFACGITAAIRNSTAASACRPAASAMPARPMAAPGPVSRARAIAAPSWIRPRIRSASTARTSGWARSRSPATVSRCGTSVATRSCARSAVARCGASRCGSAGRCRATDWTGSARRARSGAPCWTPARRARRMRAVPAGRRCCGCAATCGGCITTRSTRSWASWCARPSRATVA